MTDNTPVQMCPVCHKEYTGFPALSRTDNVTSICSPCGESQALEEYYGTKDSRLDIAGLPHNPEA
jgi:RNA polymerase subunit RPABC4/transcription elongation factor Spt4